MRETRQLLRILRTQGLLLKQDRALANVVSILVGHSVSGSWWAHPQAHRIFRAMSELARRPEVVVAKLVAGKDTFVHRRLWPALVGVGRARERWQLYHLSPAARRMLAALARRGQLTGSGAAARELAVRLLVHSTDSHSALGWHQRVLETWERWTRRRGLRRVLAPAAARAALEAAATALGAKPRALPWHRFGASRG
jgi:hypothetical protein